jgi:hypothetical protein
MTERSRRADLPADAPGKEGGPQPVDNYPVLFEFETSGLNVKQRKDAQPGDVFGGEASITGSVDLRTRVKRVYVPAAHVAEATAKLRAVIGHDEFEVLALEAARNTPISQDMAVSHAKSMDTLKKNERFFNAVVEAYAEAATTGKHVDDDLFWEKW